MPVRIITDSGSEYKSSDHPALEVLPLTVAFGDDVYREGVDITYDQFYELLAEREEFPSTGQATPFLFQEALERAREAGEDVVIITMSSRLSGTYQNACMAATAAREAGLDTVRVVDSLNMTLGERIPSCSTRCSWLTRDLGPMRSPMPWRRRCPVCVSLVWWTPSSI